LYLYTRYELFLTEYFLR